MAAFPSRGSMISYVGRQGVSAQKKRIFTFYQAKWERQHRMQLSEVGAPILFLFWLRRSRLVIL